ncbi:helix-turn-helix domain-containing protein [Candidatus Hodarchaeum mangrovi]
MSLGLDSLDLDFQETKIYISLIALGPLSLGEIEKQTEFSTEETRKYLEGLKQKGYVFDIQGITPRYRAILPFNGLKVSGDQSIIKMENLISELETYVKEKLGSITKKLSEESKKLSDSFNTAKTTLDQAEMNAESDIEAKIAHQTLEIEQGTEQEKANLKNLFESIEKEHQGFLTTLRDQKSSKIDKMNESFIKINKEIESQFSSDLEKTKLEEEERNNKINEEFDKSYINTNELLSTGIQSVHQKMGDSGKLIFDSIDDRNDRITSHIIELTDTIKKSFKDISSPTQATTINSINKYNENLQNQILGNKKNLSEVLVGSRDEIKSKTVASAQNIQQTVTQALVETQNQILDMFQKSQEALSQKVSEIRNHIEESINQFSEAVKVQTDTDIEELLINTESTLSNLGNEAGNLTKQTQETLTATFNELINSTDSKSDSIKITAIQELENIIQQLKKELESQINEFNSTLVPQEEELNEILQRFKQFFNDMQNQSMSNFNALISELKSSIITKKAENEKVISEEITILKSEIDNLISNLTSQFQSYDSNFHSTISGELVKSSEHLISQTREFQTKIFSVVDELHKTSIEHLDATNEIIQSSFQTEIATLEKELSDYSTKFKDVTAKNEDIFKNYLYSLDKIASLVKDTKQPPVQTAPIVSKNATLIYIREMMARMKGGITLLLPVLADIPIQEILQTKSHQRVNLVTIIDPTAHRDLLKKLFQKPNVRVRSVDAAKFVGVENYIAADRDGEEVLVAVKEDQGEVVAIASLADAFINLMGKIVLGDYFLARSQEITRAEVGM